MAVGTKKSYWIVGFFRMPCRRGFVVVLALGRISRCVPRLGRCTKGHKLIKFL